MRFLTSLFLFAALFSLFFAAPIRADEPDHEHESEFAFEYLGITDVKENEVLTYTAAKVNGNYNGFPSNVMYFVPFTAAQLGGATSVEQASNLTAVQEAMEAAEHEATEAIHHSDGAHCTDVTTCGVITPSANTCYRLIFDQDSHMSSYKVRINSPDTVALVVFSEHVPAEFTGPIEFFTDKDGVARWFLLEEFNHEHNHDDHPQANGKKVKSVRKIVNNIKRKIGGAH